MADWKTQISYNYNPSYHAYAYGLVYQPGSEQSHGNHLAGVMDLSSYNAGMTQAYYATARAARDESPPGSPEQPAAGGHHHYPGSGVVYLGDSQSGRLLLGRPHRVAYDARENEVRRVGSDSTSDSEAHTSPDSWSSSSTSSREGLPQADPTSWAKQDLDEASNRSPVVDVSSSLTEEPHAFAVAGNEEGANDTTSLHKPITAPNEQSTASNPKRKARTAFSEVQMNALVQRFSVQRYLTPAEMKNLAELTGLTYKQVKTWFQNRRMKLRRHQKDSSWVSERYSVNKDSPGHGSMYTNIPSHVPPYGGEAQSQLKEHYNQHMMETDFKKATPQNLAFYLAAMGSAAGSAGYPSWSPGPSQTAVPARPQAVGWSMPPGVGHYDYNTNTFNSPGHDTSFESKEDEHVS
ncbi:Homeodomain transcription factor Nanog [Scophthalmus maximus]|uniref:Homeodomain transcription factor Nanog n=1 Tax=Scophthalmus maximus TaxID=52904 RepID=A0A2U9CXT8_SCOMX|nr:homeobox protein NANOG [Scophthalmus maximus]AWP20840.1 Homeodomain transcription factor Nanog [Scophthalmus maximus]